MKTQIKPVPSQTIPQLPHDLNDEQEDEANEGKQVNPLTVKEGHFQSIYGWLDHETILWSYERAGTYYLSSHHLFTNESTIIFTTFAPIVDVIVHPDREKILIHTSPHTYGAEIFVINVKGEIHYSTEIESHELAFEWSDTDDSKLLITAFNADWSYKVYSVNTTTKQLTERNHLQPFMKWYGDQTIIEQRWEENGLSFFAPLWKTLMSDQQSSSLLLENVYHFDVHKDYLMAITVPDDDQTTIEYHFYNRSMEQLGMRAAPI
ncbi:hypothetical protein ACI2OX_09675 [Bacillus sp. N9]